MRSRSEGRVRGAVQSCLLLTQLLSVQTFAADAFSAPTWSTVDGERLQRADEEPGNWLNHGRTQNEARESPLAQITPDNVSRLGLAWYYDLDSRRGLEASPLVVDGVMYTTSTWSRVFAHDAGTGELLWQFDPEVPRAWGANACCDVVNRGVALAGNHVFVGTLDGRLVALDRRTGEVGWDVLTIDPDRPYTITGAPRVVHDTVVIGNGGAEYGVRGYVSAYDAATGALRWRFHTVPGDPEEPFENAAMAMAAETWTGDVYHQVGGGGTVWDSMAFDPELDLLYIGVGNGSPWNRHIRSPEGGDNLFLSSVVALNARTGAYVWHYQTTPGDTWDYTATQHMILADLRIDGRDRQVLMQAPKNGFFYVLDRSSGELISAEKYVPINWASHVDLETGRPVETELADHSESMQLTRPAPFGGHNWQPMAFNREHRLVFIPAMENVAPYSTQSAFMYREGSHWNTGMRGGAAGDPALMIADPNLIVAVMRRLMRGRLLAWDPVEQREVWRVEHETNWNGGVLTTTSGLVFQGNGTGQLVAYRAETGAVLWSFDAGNGIIAPPISFAVGGEQYVAVLAGWGGAVGLVLPDPNAVGGGPGRLLVFKLNGQATLQAAHGTPQLPEPPMLSADSDTVDQGLALYSEHCLRCHGAAGISSGAIRDLRYMSKGTHELFDQIVRGGIFSAIGMISFADQLSEGEVEAIRQYLIYVARVEWEDRQASQWWLDLRGQAYDLLARMLVWLAS